MVLSMRWYTVVYLQQVFLPVLNPLAWERGRPLIWDVTVPDSLATSYRPVAISSASAVAALAESLKEAKYCDLTANHIFTPLAIESLGSVRPKSLSFAHDLGCRIMRYSGEAMTTTYLIQRLSIAVQRGNAALVMDTFSPFSSDSILF
uniref:Uncharacterized protein n=1 Tax=Amphimedon queenslandica TaxID=400682 RepID=A0A1X7V2J0_AMPQE